MLCFFDTKFYSVSFFCQQCQSMHAAAMPEIDFQPSSKTRLLTRPRELIGLQNDRYLRTPKTFGNVGGLMALTA